MDEERDDAGRDGQTRLETKFSGENGDREKRIFSVQLITSGMGNQPHPVDPFSAESANHAYC